MPNFTPEDLLLYQSGELDEVKSEVITEELSANWALREKFHVLKEAFARLNAITLQAPRKQTIQSIMRYAMRKPVTV
ncbi:MAG: hypothetical protein ABJB05_13200 [Parafilimonas sp.]